MVTIPYYPLGREMILRIVNLQLSRVIKRMQDEHNIHLQIAPEVYEQVANQCQQVESGGRLVESIITNTLLPSLSRMLLEAMLVGQDVTAIDVCVTEGDFGYFLHQ